MRGVCRVLSGCVLAVSIAAVVAADSQDPLFPSTLPAPATPELPDQPAASAPELTRPSFVDWLDGVRADALARGIRPAIVDEAFRDVTEPLPVVIERDRAQLESIHSLEEYVTRRLTPTVVETARQKFAEYRQLLESIGARYGVPPRIVVGIWGLESNFGHFAGVRPTIGALATLAWDPRRSLFFRGELLDALEILNRGDIEVGRMRGSWAGAMGQTQFMPSSYLRYAEDFDGDGRRDIWSSPADVFASIANFLKGHGWKAGESWGREVVVSADAARRISATVAHRTGPCQATRDMTVRLPMTAWRRLGVRLPRNRPLPTSELHGSLVSGASTHYLVYDNYDALLRYNCAHAYAVSVARLADRLSGAPSPAPRRDPATDHRVPARH